MTGSHHWGQQPICKHLQTSAAVTFAALSPRSQEKWQQSPRQQNLLDGAALVLVSRCPHQPLSPRLQPSPPSYFRLHHTLASQFHLYIPDCYLLMCKRGEGGNPDSSEQKYPNIPILAAKVLPFLHSIPKSHLVTSQTTWHGDNPSISLPKQHLPQCPSWEEANFWGIKLNSPFLSTWWVYPPSSRWLPHTPPLAFLTGFAPPALPVWDVQNKTGFGTDEVLSQHHRSCGNSSHPTTRLPTHHLPLPH